MSERGRSQTGPLPHHAAGFSFALALLVAMAAGPLSLYSVSSLAPLLASDLGLTSTHLGVLAAIAYGSAAASAFLTGHLVDRASGLRSPLLAILAGSALALTIVALANSYLALAVAMVVAGVAQSGSNPVTNRAVATRVPHARQGTFVGIKQSGVQAQQFLVGAVIVPVAVTVGWRPAVALGLSLILIGAVATRRSVPSAATRRTGAVAPPSPETTAEEFPLVRLLVYTFCNGALVTSVNVHVALFAFDEVGMTAGVAGGLSGVIGALGVLGRIGWGQIAQRQTGFAGPLRLLAAASGVAIVIIWASMAQRPVLLWIGTCLFAVSAVPGNVVAMLAIVRSVPRRKTGSVTGLLMIALYSGFMFGPFAFGLIVDEAGSYSGAWSFAATLALVSFGSMMTRPPRSSS